MTRHSRIIDTGQNNWQPRAVQTEAERQHHHGRLVPMDDRQPGDGELVHIGALLCLASAGLTIFTIWSVLT